MLKNAFIVLLLMGHVLGGDIANDRTLKKDLMFYFPMDGHFQEAADGNALKVKGKAEFAKDRFGIESSAWKASANVKLSLDEVPLAMQSFSFHFWAKSINGWIVSQGKGAKNQGLLIGRNGSSLRFTFWSNDLDAALPKGEGWHHYVCTYDSKNKNQTIYIDGEQASQKNGRDPFNGNGPLQIGQRFDKKGAFKGLLDELALWKRALNAHEVRKLYNGGTGLPYREPEGKWTEKNIVTLNKSAISSLNGKSDSEIYVPVRLPEREFGHMNFCTSTGESLEHSLIVNLKKMTAWVKMTNEQFNRTPCLFLYHDQEKVKRASGKNPSGLKFKDGLSEVRENQIQLKASAMSQWMKSFEVAIEWQTSGFVNNVRIDIGNEKKWVAIVESTKNTGSFNWVIPENFQEGAYQIRVSSVPEGVVGISEKKISVVSAPSTMLDQSQFAKYPKNFSTWHKEGVVNAIPDNKAWMWMRQNIPMLEISDKEIEEMYFFRWWTYRKHIRGSVDGYVITEFIVDVRWAGKHNTISCPAGHHFYEGRWIHNPEYLNDYAKYWFRVKGAKPRGYSFYAADSYYKFYLIHQNKDLLIDLLPDLIGNYKAWEKVKYHPSVGLFWQDEWSDGMERSIMHHLKKRLQYRPTINAYMIADARAIAAIARMKKDEALAKEYQDKADRLQKKMLSTLWDPKTNFFKGIAINQKTRKPPEKMEFNPMREFFGYVPWQFDLPEEKHGVAWKELLDPKGFYAPFGPTSIEQREKRFGFMWTKGKGTVNNTSDSNFCCTWDGPSWPYLTSQALVGLANYLDREGEKKVVGKDAFWKTLKAYTKGQHDKNGHPWIAENLCGNTGKWIGNSYRARFYNHSTYTDNIISGLIGLRPRDDNKVVVNPMFPEDKLDYFMLDRILYHGKMLTIAWDKTGKKYKFGKGLHLFVDNKKVASREDLGRLMYELDS